MEFHDVDWYCAFLAKHKFNAEGEAISAAEKHHFNAKNAAFYTAKKRHFNMKNVAAAEDRYFDAKNQNK